MNVSTCRRGSPWSVRFGHPHSRELSLRTPSVAFVCELPWLDTSLLSHNGGICGRVRTARLNSVAQKVESQGNRQGSRHICIHAEDLLLLRCFRHWQTEHTDILPAGKHQPSMK